MNENSRSYESKTETLRKRPDICLSNNGDSSGKMNTDGMPLTCPAAFIRTMQQMLIDRGYQCSLNEPFRGGDIIQTYGSHIPCLQMELSKRLFMTADDGECDTDRLHELQQRLSEVLSLMDQKKVE